MTKCTWSTVDGLPCNAEALIDSPSGRCFIHDDRPEIAQQRAQARSRGGKAKPKGAPVRIDVSSPEAILESLRAVGQALADGETDRSTANALSYVLSSAAQTTKLVGHEKRIKRLEIRLGLAEPEESDA